MCFIFLYQRYIYKEDKSRVNEFGFSGDPIRGEKMRQPRKMETLRLWKTRRMRRRKKEDYLQTQRVWQSFGCVEEHAETEIEKSKS